MYKYRINELLEKLTMKEYQQVIRIIPRILEVSGNTFYNYRNIKLGESRDIPHLKVLQLERLFNLKIGELLTEKPEFPTLEELLRERQKLSR